MVEDKNEASIMPLNFLNEATFIFPIGNFDSEC